MDILRRTLAAALRDWVYGLGLIFAVVGIVTWPISVARGLTAWSLLSAVLVFVGFARLVWGWRRAMAPGRALTRDNRDPRALPDDYEQPYDNWTRHKRGGADVIYDPDLNARLISEDLIAIHKKGGRWRPDTAPANEFARIWPTKEDIHNNWKLRLNTDLTASSDSVEVQRTDYASYLVTSNLAKKEVYRSGVRQLTLEDVVVRPSTGQVRRLSASQTSNQLGGDILAISPGRAFLQVQGKTEVNPGLRVASGSGSFDYADLWFSKDLVTLVKKGLLRELREEMGLPRWRRSTPGRDDVRLIGFSRATYMGGKPQFYGVARVAPSVTATRRFSERRWLERPGYAVEFDHDLGVSDLIARLKEARDRAGPNFSESLIILIDMLDLWSQHDAGVDRWLFGRTH